MPNPERGSVLLQVMIMGIIIAFLAAGMAAMLLMRSYSSSIIEADNQGLRADEGGVNILINAWNQNGICTNDASGIYTCSSSYKSCSCTCKSSNPAYPIVAVGGSGTWPDCQPAGIAAEY